MPEHAELAAEAQEAICRRQRKQDALSLHNTVSITYSAISLKQYAILHHEPVNEIVVLSAHTPSMSEQLPSIRSQSVRGGLSSLT